MLQEAQYIAVAVRAAQFVLDRMRTEDGALVRTYRDGEKSAT